MRRRALMRDGGMGAGVGQVEGVICSNVVEGRAVSFLVTRRDDLIQGHHLNGEFYEREELAIIARHFPKGGVFVDIGANVGNHSVYVGLFLEPALIVPFEPNPAVLPTLGVNLLLNRLMGLVDEQGLGAGLSDAAGEAEAVTPDAGNLGLTRMRPGDGGTIRLLRGDDALAGRAVDFLKIDVEGMEMRVLAGLAATIGRCRPRLFVEVDNANAAAFEAWLGANDYRVAERFRRYDSNENFMAVPRERG